MNVIFRRLWNDLLDLFYPNLCCACHRSLVGNEEVICTNCRLNLPYSNGHLIRIPSLMDKFVGKVAVKAVFTFLKFEKRSKVQRLLHQLKYNNRPDIAQTLGRLYGLELKKAGIDEQLNILIPIPLHTRKREQRGYNQSDAFAEGLSESLGIAWSSELLQRVRFTATQTHKTRFERFENVAGIFEVTQSAKIQGKSIGLIDDVVTTGATLESAIDALLQSGAKEVSVITIAAAY